MGPGAGEAQVLERDLTGVKFGNTEVVEVRAERVQEEGGEWVIHLELVLSDPPQDKGTWPFDDVLQLRRHVADLAGAQQDGLMVYVQVVPATDTTDEGDDTGGKGIPQSLF